MGGSSVVSLTNLGTVALLGNEFLLGREAVGPQSLALPDFIE